MTNVALLEKKIRDSGKKKTYLAEKLGISYQGFLNLCSNKAEFKARQIKILCEELFISPDEMLLIFFADKGA